MVIKKEVIKKAPRKPKSTEDKILKELKNISKILKESREILDAIWKERRPQ